MGTSWRQWPVWIAALCSAAASAQDATPRNRGTPELMRALAGGGYVIYFRHGHTQWQQKILEQAMQAEGRHDLANCATQRNLDTIGRDDAKRIGAALQSARIPVGDVLASLYCRPAEYVQLITGKTPQRVRWLTGLSTPETLREIKRAVATPPAAGANTVLAGHGDRPFDLTGLVIQEGDALVFDPRQHRADDPGKFKPLAWIKPAEWPMLAAAVGAAAPAADAAPAVPRVVRIEWPSSVHHGADNVRASLPALVEGRALDDAALARGLALARENPSRNLEVVFTPDSSASNAVTAQVALADVRPWRLGAGIDHASAHADAGAPGHDRVWLTATHANLWQRDHVATLRFARAARSDHDTWSGAYQVPLPGWDTMLGLALTRADDGAGLDALGRVITGAGRTMSVLARRHLSPRADYHHHLQLTLADHDWFARDGVAAVRSRPLALRYAGHWEEEWIGWHVGVEGVINLPGGTRNDAAHYALATGGAATSHRWQALRADGEWLRILTYDIRLRLSARAQWADRPLIPGERFALGGTLAPWGSAFGVWSREPWLHRVGLRGVPERAIAGDDGALVSAELWSRRLWGHDLRIGGFVDAGQVHRRGGAGTGLDARPSASSVGVGAHWQRRGQLAAALSAAQLVDGADSLRRGARRVDFTLVASY